MAKVLTVRNAELNTAAISIRTLQVEGRQVTLAVFRQLQVEDIVNDAPALEGVGWGHVNYLIEGEWRYSGDTIHLVWQKGQELRRCLVHETLNVHRFDEPKRPALDENYLASLRKWRDEHSPDHSAYAYNEERIVTCERDLKAWRLRYQEAKMHYDREVRWIEARNALVRPLFDLPQLFIAV